MRAHARSIRISPRKLNVVADLVRGKTVRQATDLLRFVPKRGAKVLLKVVRSAQANAERTAGGTDTATLRIAHIVVNKASVLRRSRFAARGRVKPIRKPLAHVSVLLAPPPST